MTPWRVPNRFPVLRRPWITEDRYSGFRSGYSVSFAACGQPISVGIEEVVTTFKFWQHFNPRFHRLSPIKKRQGTVRAVPHFESLFFYLCHPPVAGSKDSGSPSPSMTNGWLTVAPPDTSIHEAVVPPSEAVSAWTVALSVPRLVTAASISAWATVTWPSTGVSFAITASISFVISVPSLVIAPWISAKFAMIFFCPCMIHPAMPTRSISNGRV